MFLIDWIVEYRQLRARPLCARRDADEEARFRDLERWLEKPRPDGCRAPAYGRRYPRFEVSLAAVVEDVDGAFRARVVNVSGGGLAIVPAPGVARGDILLVTLDDGRRRVRFPDQARWRGPRAAGSAVGCAFVGVPEVESLLAAPNSDGRPHAGTRVLSRCCTGHGACNGEPS